MPITIFRCAHKPEELNENFERLFKECDVLMVEQGVKDGRNNLEKFYNQVSFGEQHPIDFFRDFFTYGAFDNYVYKLVSFLSNSGKRVVIEDSPMTVNELKKWEILFTGSLGAYYTGNLQDACRMQIKALECMKELDNRREDSLKKQLVMLQRENRESKILFPIGAEHLIYYKLKDKGLEVKQEFPYKPYFLSYGSEVHRRVTVSKPYTNEMIARLFPERIVEGHLMKSGLSLSKATERARKISGRLSYEDVKDLSINTRENFPNVIESTILWLRKKGFEL